MCAKRRLTISSWYIGSGNKPSTFNRKARGAYDSIRNRYTSELEKERKAGKDKPEMSFETRQALKEKIRSQIKKERYWEIAKLIFSLAITIALALWFFNN